jgi:hypothetical protein
MFRDPIRTAPLVADVTDVYLRLRVQRADSTLFLSSDLRFPAVRVR